MIETGVIREFEPGMFALTLQPCSTAVLPLILDLAVPHVWVVGHWPGSHVHWWQASVPLSEHTPNRSVWVRDVQFDLQMETLEFLRLESEFRHGGITLLQMLRRVPDTLRVPGLPDRSRWRILRDNGLHLEFHLPHPGDYASLASPSRALLESFVGDPHLAGDLP
jgi:hypothetical protein